MKKFFMILGLILFSFSASADSNPQQKKPIKGIIVEGVGDKETLEVDSNGFVLTKNMISANVVGSPLTSSEKEEVIRKLKFTNCIKVEGIYIGKTAAVLVYQNGDIIVNATTCKGKILVKTLMKTDKFYLYMIQ